MVDLTDRDLDALEQAAKAATRGEWTAMLPGGAVALFAGDGSCFVARADRPEDAVHIARANPAAVLALVAEVRAYRASDGSDRRRREGAWLLAQRAYLAHKRECRACMSGADCETGRRLSDEQARLKRAALAGSDAAPAHSRDDAIREAARAVVDEAGLIATHGYPPHALLRKRIPELAAALRGDE